jgi:ketosteroid isomerase-like protein
MSDVDPVQQLLAIEAIKQLKARYFRFVDVEDYESLRGLFVDDAEFEVEGYPISGADGLVGRIREHHTNAEVRTVHHGHMPEIEITGEDTARGIWAMFDYVDRIWKDDGRREAFHGYGHYTEEYRKVNGAWKIASMKLTRIRVDLLPEPISPFPHRDGPAQSILPPPAS